MDTAPKPNDRVRITVGTFQDCIGVVLKPGSLDAAFIFGADPATAVLVSLRLSDREVPVLVDPAFLQPAKPPA